MPKPGRPRKHTPDEARAREKQQRHDWWVKNREKANERRRERRWRHGQKRLVENPPEGLSIVSAATLANSKLSWMDTSGKLHREDQLSAEQLIKRWQHAQAKKNL